MAIKQKRPNAGINEFVIRAFDYDNRVVGQFNSRQTESLALKSYSCPPTASVCCLMMNSCFSI